MAKQKHVWTKEQKQAITAYAEEHYDRLTLRMKSGCKEQLIQYMSEKIEQIRQLESLETCTPEQERQLQDLKSLYGLSKQGTPSVNGLILGLLHNETGIDF